MPQSTIPDLSPLLQALASESRRELLRLLRDEPRTLLWLTEHSGLPAEQLQADLQTLRSVGAVRFLSQRGGSQAYQTDPAALRALADLLAQWRPSGSSGADTLLQPQDGHQATPSDDIDERAKSFSLQRPDVPAEVYAIGQRMVRLGAHVDRALTEAASKLDLLGVELMLLDALMLTQDHTLTPTQLRQRLHLSQGGITKCVARLEAMGMVQRRPDPSDGRGVLVSLLPKAVERMRHSDLWGPDAVATFQMTPERRGQLADLLREMLRLADQEAQRRKQR